MNWHVVTQCINYLILTFFTVLHYIFPARLVFIFPNIIDLTRMFMDWHGIKQFLSVLGSSYMLNVLPASFLRRVVVLIEGRPSNQSRDRNNSNIDHENEELSIGYVFQGSTSSCQTSRRMFFLPLLPYDWYLMKSKKQQRKSQLRNLRLNKIKTLQMWRKRS